MQSFGTIGIVVFEKKWNIPTHEAKYYIEDNNNKTKNMAQKPDKIIHVTEEFVTIMKKQFMMCESETTSVGIHVSTSL